MLTCDHIPACAKSSRQNKHLNQWLPDLVAFRALFKQEMENGETD